MCEDDRLGVDFGVFPVAEPLGHASFRGSVVRVPGFDLDRDDFAVLRVLRLTEGDGDDGAEAAVIGFYVTESAFAVERSDEFCQATFQDLRDLSFGLGPPSTSIRHFD